MADSIVVDLSAGDSYVEYDPGAPWDQVYAEMLVYIDATALSTFLLNGSSQLLTISDTVADPTSQREHIEIDSGIHGTAYWGDFFVGGSRNFDGPGWHLLRAWWDNSDVTAGFTGADGAVAPWRASSYGAFGVQIAAAMFGGANGSPPGPTIYVATVKLGTAIGLADILDFDASIAPDLSAFTTVVGSCVLGSAPTPPVNPIPNVQGDIIIDTGAALGDSPISEPGLRFVLPPSTGKVYVEAVVMWPAASQWADITGSGSPEFVETRTTQDSSSANQGLYLWISGGTDLYMGDYWDSNGVGPNLPALDPDVFHTVKMFIDGAGGGYFDIDGAGPITYTGQPIIDMDHVLVGIACCANTRGGKMYVRSVKIGSDDGLSDIYDYDPSAASTPYGEIGPGLPFFDIQNRGDGRTSMDVFVPSGAPNLRNMALEEVVSFVEPLSLGPLPGASRFFKGFDWRFIVTDLQYLTTTWAQGLLEGRKITAAGNQAGVIESDVHPDDFRINGIFTDGYPRLAQSNRLVFAFRREGISANSLVPWVCRAAGILMSPDDSGDPDVPLSRFVAYDPWKYLEARPALNNDGSLPGQNGILTTGPGSDTALQMLLNTMTYDGGVFIDAGVAWGGTAFWAGTIEVTDDIALTIQSGQSVADVWNALCDAGNMDIVLRPIYDPTRFVTIGGTDYYFTHELSIYKLGGQRRPNALHAWDRLNRSLTKIERMHDGTPGSFFNKVLYFSGAGGVAADPTMPYVNVPSVNAFGSYWAQQFFPALTTDGSGSAAAALAAQSLVLAKQGRRTLTMDAITGRAPVPLQAYEVLDRIPVHASKRLRVTADGYFRVQGFTIDISDDGVETITSLVVSPDWRGAPDT